MNQPTSSSGDLPSGALVALSTMHAKVAMFVREHPMASPDDIARVARGAAFDACTEAHRSGEDLGRRKALVAIPSFVACRACGATVDVPR